jgi:hypothetical protein
MRCTGRSRTSATMRLRTTSPGCRPRWQGPHPRTRS